MSNDVPFGPTGETIYQRTYSRPKPDGTRETWPETVARVAEGNLALVYGRRESWTERVVREFEELVAYMRPFKIMPAGRHLWASGVKGRQYLFNCHVSGWGQSFSQHFEFTFLRLMEGGGVGANYSSRYLARYGAPRRQLRVHVVCDPLHPDYQAMLDAGLLSTEYSYEWEGSFPIEDSREGWASGLVDLLDTYMTDEEVLHQDRVVDVSRVRRKGAALRTFGGTASGPQPFAQMLHDIAVVMNEAYTFPAFDLHHLRPTDAMDIDHAIAACVVAGGNRRSARMAIVHWRDPFLGEFLRSKQDGSKNWSTNISVEIDQEFVEALEAGDPEARAIHMAVVAGMLTNGEPGYWNSSMSQVGEVGEVVATNPCGEIALEAWENCNLGHVNLDAFAPRSRQPHDRDRVGLARAHQLVTRFLIRATYGDVNDEGQAAKLAANRRIGVGHFGVQGYFAKQGLPYSLVPSNEYARRELRGLYKVVREEARRYAFELRIPEPVKVTTVAPTGTIAKLPGVTEGIHAIYARYFNRRVRFSLADPDQAAAVTEFWAQGFQVETCVYDASGNTAVVTFPTKDKLVAEVEALGYPAEFVESQDELTVDQLLAFQAMYQECYADNAVSFTVNVPAEPHQELAMLADPFGDVPAPTPERVADVAASIARALPALKGTTLMLDGSRQQAPYERITEAEYLAAAAKLVSDGIDEECASGACPVR